MKRVNRAVRISLLLLLSVCGILLISCQRKAESERSFDPPIPGLTWGLTYEDLLDALSEFEYTVITEDEKATEIRFNSSVFGYPATMFCMVDRMADIGLYYLDIQFQNDHEEELKEKLTKQVGKPDSESAEADRLIWKSDPVQNLPEETQQRIRYVRIDCKFTGMGSTGMWGSLQREPLVQIIFHDGHLIYNAQNMALYRAVSDEERFDEICRTLSELTGNEYQ